MNKIYFLFFVYIVQVAFASGNNFYLEYYSSTDDSSITISVSDSSRVYEIGKTCDTCTILIKGLDNLVLKEYRIENGKNVKHIVYEYKKKELSSMLVFNSGKLTERRSDYGRDDDEYRNTYKSTIYYDDGKINETGSIKKTYKNGVWTEYYTNGKFKTLTTYLLDKKEGKYKEYYENGKIKLDGTYKQNKMFGYWTEYDSSGTFVKGHTYDLLSMHGLSIADLKACVTIKEASNRSVVVKLKSKGYIAIEYKGANPISDAVLKAIKNDTVYVSIQNKLEIDKDIFAIPVSEIISVGYIKRAGTTIAFDAYMLNTYRVKPKWEYIQMNDRKYTIDFYDEDCL